MSPKPSTENSQPKYPPDHEDPLDAARGIFNAIICMIVIITCLVGAAWIWTSIARAHTPRPIPAPASLLHAREACPNTASIVQCRTALRHAYDAVTWQRHERLHQGAYGVDHAIRLASALYGVPESEMRSVGACESHLTPSSKNTSSTASGLFQFLDSTWARAGVPGFSVFDPYANAIAAARLVTRDHGWHEWSCQP